MYVYVCVYMTGSVVRGLLQADGCMQGETRLSQAERMALCTPLQEVPWLLHLHACCRASEVAFTGTQNPLTSGLLGFVL